MTQRAKRLPSGVREQEAFQEPSEKEHVLSALVENKPGVLSRVAGLFTRRNFNIDSLAVGETEKPEYSRMTIVVKGDDKTVEQVIKQLNTLIPVIKVSNLTDEETVDRELALFKVKSNPESRSEIMQIVETFRAKVIDVGKKSVIIEATGDTEKIAAMEDMLKEYGIREVARTGNVSLARGPKTTA